MAATTMARDFNQDPCPDMGIHTVPTPETRSWVVLELLRSGYGLPLKDLLSLYYLTLDDVYEYEPRWRREMGYTGPPLLPVNGEV